MDGGAKITHMDHEVFPQIIAVDRVNHGTCIYFSDGSQGFYSDALLYSILNQTEPLPEEYAAD
jgi:hypothetical protein